MRNSQSLELYLAQIAHELRDLPPQARADEMREIEAHLRALVLAGQQLEDISADAATATALRQFGEPRRIGRKLRRAWERKQPEAWWRAVLAPIIAATSFFFGGSALMQCFFALHLLPYGIPYGFNSVISLICFTSSYIAGLISPKRGLFGIMGLLILITLNGITTEDFLNSSWIIQSVIVCVSAIVGVYFGARFNRKRATRIAR